MRSSHVCGCTLATSLIAFGIGLGAPIASADPTDPASTDAPAPAPGGAPAPAPGGAPAPAPITDSAQIPDVADPAAADACKQFAGALNYAATNYEDFAYDSAGGGDVVNYNDPSVATDNTLGRTALREAAAAGLAASTTPGLSPDISAPMQAWSMQATRLLLIMGIRGGGDSLNAAATDMNTQAHNAQMACAQAGTHA